MYVNHGAKSDRGSKSEKRGNIEGECIGDMKNGTIVEVIAGLGGGKVAVSELSVSFSVGL